MTNLTNPIFHDEETARRHFEALRWPDGPICPHCGSLDNATELQGKSTRAGVYKCKDCRKPFSVTVRTVMERSHIPLSKCSRSPKLNLRETPARSAFFFHLRPKNGRRLHRLAGLLHTSRTQYLA